MRKADPENAAGQKRAEVVGPLDEEEMRGIGKERLEAKVIAVAGAETVRVDVEYVPEARFTRRQLGATHENKGRACGNSLYAEPLKKPLRESGLPRAELSAERDYGRSVGGRSFLNDALRKVRG